MSAEWGFFLSTNTPKPSFPSLPLIYFISFSISRAKKKRDVSVLTQTDWILYMVLELILLDNKHVLNQNILNTYPFIETFHINKLSLSIRQSNQIKPTHKSGGVAQIKSPDAREHGRMLNETKQEEIYG